MDLDRDRLGAMQVGALKREKTADWGVRHGLRIRVFYALPTAVKSGPEAERRSEVIRRPTNVRRLVAWIVGLAACLALFV